MRCCALVLQFAHVTGTDISAHPANDCIALMKKIKTAAMSASRLPSAQTFHQNRIHTTAPTHHIGKPRQFFVNTDEVVSYHTA
jgi:hypothetical protein